MTTEQKKKQAEYKRQFQTDLRLRTGLTYAWGAPSSPGMFTIEAMQRQFLGPVCVIWFFWTGNTSIGIMNIYTVDFARRCGVATWLLSKLVEAYPALRRLQTEQGTKEGGGEKWLIANGFKMNKASLDWEKIVRTK